MSISQITNRRMGQVMEEDNLPPCPQCGDQPIIKQDKIGKYWPKCPCEICGTMFWETKEDAAEAWKVIVELVNG